MTAAEAIAQVRAAGVDIVLDSTGNGLELLSDGDPPPEIVDLVRAHKPEIVAHIRYERARINKWIADRLGDWSDRGTCWHCRKALTDL